MVTAYLAYVMLDMSHFICAVLHVVGAALPPRRRPTDPDHRRERHVMAPQADLKQATTHDKAITIVHETFGDPSHPAVLLVMGFGTQLIGWDADFCGMLASRGRYVIRYDNRDCGLSTKL